MTGAANTGAKFQQPDTYQQVRARVAAVCGTAPCAGQVYGYLPGELIGGPAGSLVPDGLRAAHVSQRAGYAGRPTACPAVRITKISEAVCMQDAVRSAVGGR